MASRLLDPSWAAAAPPPHGSGSGLVAPNTATSTEDDDHYHLPTGAMSPVSALSGSRRVDGSAGAEGRGGDGRSRGPRKLVLCFDGTGNKFHGDESDSNILKIFRMLDRTAGDQYHYYQPGIGTYVVSGSLSHTGVRARVKSWCTKAKDSAVGSSFDQHVVGGYRFLMRFYNPGDEIYMFGFSRGAYIARFLAEMLDHIGLLSHGNEEMVRFAWKAFAQWQSRRQSSSSEAAAAAAAEEKGDVGVQHLAGAAAEAAADVARKMYVYMKGFRETFSRPVGRIRFLGLFDTVNSVPRFETAWMQRSKFPFTARSSARVIRHAVSIDERRAKFRQDLMYQTGPKRHHRHRHRRHRHLGQLLDPLRLRSAGAGAGAGADRPREASATDGEKAGAAGDQEKPSTATGGQKSSTTGEEKPSTAGGEKSGSLLAPNDRSRPRQQQPSQSGLSPLKPYRPRSRPRRMSLVPDADGASCASGIGSACDDGPAGDDDDDEQSIDEIWFAGGHGDVGGGWEALDGRKSASHVPLTWMVREASKAGLTFDMEKVAELGCSWEIPGTASGSKQPAIQVRDENNGLQTGPPVGELSAEAEVNSSASPIHALMHRAHTSRIHDSLLRGGGLGAMAVAAWNVMEWLPLRRLDLQTDGSWKPIRWPLPRGEVRDMPDNARVHGSVIRRLKEDEAYRPGNLIMGGGGRGVRRAPAEHGIGDWVCVSEPGDPIGEVWVRKVATAKTNGH